jgi:hypothetical protein
MNIAPAGFERFQVHFERAGRFGHAVVVLLDGKQTGEKFTAFLNISPPGCGPGPHYHEREDEWFYIVARLSQLPPAETDGDCTGRKMNDNPFAHTCSEQFLRCFAGGVEVDSTLPDNIDARCALGLKFV